MDVLLLLGAPTLLEEYITLLDRMIARSVQKGLIIDRQDTCQP